MEYTLTKNNNATANLNVTFTAEEIELAFQKAYERAQKKVKINGFRQGKAPLNVVIKMLGNSVSEDAINGLLNDFVSSHFYKFEHSPYSYPRFEVEKFDRHSTLVAKSTYETYPKVQLGEYKNLEIKDYKILLTEEELNKDLQEIQRSLAKIESKEEGESSQDGDMVEVNIATIPKESNEPSKAFPKSQIRYFIGRPDNAKGMDQHFLGLKVGETKEFSYTYPEDHKNSSFANKEFNYNIEVLGVYKVHYPAIDDNLAMEYVNLPTLDELKVKINQNKEAYYTSRLNEMHYEDLLSRIVSSSSFEIPDSMVLSEVKNVFHEFIHEKNLSHISIADYAKMVGKSENEVIDTLKEIAVKKIKNSLVMLTIAHQEKVEVSEEDLEKAYQEREANGSNHHHDHHNNETPEEHKQHILSEIKNQLTVSKVLNFILENSKKLDPSSVSVEEVFDILSKRSK